MIRPFIKFSIMFICVFIFYSAAIAVDESITFTTYYPSPTGSYHELRSARMAIGEGYINPTNFSWEATPPTIEPNADLVVEGRVGIGTPTPGYLLDLRGGTRGGGITNVLALHHAGPQLNSGDGAALLFKGTHDDHEYRLGSIYGMNSGAVGSGFAGSLVFQTKPADGIEAGSLATAMTIDYAGNVGIGKTTSLIAKLDALEVGTSSGAVRAGNFLANGAGGDQHYGIDARALGATSNYGVYGFASGDSGTTNYGIFGETSGTGGTYWAGYFNGNVYIRDKVGIGIGATNPQTTLDVGGLVRVGNYDYATPPTTPPACTASLAGSIIYYSGIGPKSMLYCDGVGPNWTSIGGGSTAPCPGPWTQFRTCAGWLFFFPVSGSNAQMEAQCAQICGFARGANCASLSIGTGSQCFCSAGGVIASANFSDYATTCVD